MVSLWKYPKMSSEWCRGEGGAGSGEDTLSTPYQFGEEPARRDRRAGMKVKSSSSSSVSLTNSVRGDGESKGNAPPSRSHLFPESSFISPVKVCISFLGSAVEKKPETEFAA